MNTIETLSKARELHACDEAIKWLESLPPDAEPWEIDERGDWMLWFAQKIGLDNKLLTAHVLG